jgi:hypothetical protein
MAVIRKFLSTSFVDPGAPGIRNAGFAGAALYSVFDLMSYSCQMKFSSVPREGSVWGIGEKLSLTQICVGSGIMAALAGYKILPGNDGLEFRQVLRVKQGALVNPNAGHTPPHTSGQTEEST